MKKIQVYANVNPLQPNCFLEVWSSENCGSINETEWWRIARENCRFLISKGYDAYIKETIQTVFNFE